MCNSSHKYQPRKLHAAEHHPKNFMANVALLREMKRQLPLLQSAATLVFSCSSTCGAFVTNTQFSSISTFPPMGLDRVEKKKAHFSTTDKQSLELKTSADLTNGETSSSLDGLLLPYEDGSHGAAKIIISNESPEYETLSIDSFKRRLEATIIACKELKKSSLWVEVPISHARYIEACSDIEGLDFHHASGNIASLSMWLKEDVDCKIPEYATHQIGVGAIVVNSRDEILCVRELRMNYRPWKIPGGRADLGEHLEEAAIREVMEETGIECRFKGVLGFRHTQGSQCGRSEIYFVCRLEPVESVDEDGNAVIPQPIAQEGEIAATAWVPLQEYKDMVNDVVNPHPMMQKMISLHDCVAEENDIQRTVVNSIVPGRKPSPIYHAPGGIEFN